MSFEEEFPSLIKNHKQPIAAESLNGVMVCRAFREDVIRETCLDKERVKKIFDEYFSICSCGECSECLLEKGLKKELGL